MNIRQIRSATIKVYYGGQVFLIDPWLESIEQGLADPNGSFNAPLCELPCSVEEVVKDVDLCLPTHLHYDHYSPDLLPKDLPIHYQNEADYQKGLEQGFVNADWFKTDAYHLGNITIYRVDGRHGDIDSVAKRMGDVSGYVFTAPNENTLYIAGDTVFYDGVKDVIDRFHPDVIVLNSCDARVTAGRLIMNAQDVMEVCKCAPEARIIASHMDAVRHRHLTRDQLREALENTPYQHQVLIPDDGQTLSF